MPLRAFRSWRQAALKRSELPQDQPLFDRGENKFDERRFWQPCALPVAYQHLAKRSGGPKNLTRDSHGDAPLAKGQVEVHWTRFTGEELTAHAEVTCLSVVGNQAWIGTRVTKLVLDGEVVPGERRMIFRVQDNGDGAAATDLASLVFFDVTPGRDLTYCNTREQFPILRPTTTGNIQVKP